MKYENWPERLAEYLESWKDVEFQQGTDDCGHFAAGAVEVQTGINDAGRYTGRYDTVLGYLRLLRADGFQTVRDYVNSVLEPLASVKMAQRGDIVMRWEGELEALGVCDGRQTFFLMPEAGLVTVPTLECAAAWRVE